uniref:Uncharacterized protein n=1 Tax=Romanomermis culicivorax TaxID=13658 RepID=A0A915HZC1_ROMCU
MLYLNMSQVIRRENISANEEELYRHQYFNDSFLGFIYTCTILVMFAILIFMIMWRIFCEEKEDNKTKELLERVNTETTLDQIMSRRRNLMVTRRVLLGILGGQARRETDVSVGVATRSADGGSKIPLLSERSPDLSPGGVSAIKQHTDWLLKSRKQWTSVPAMVVKHALKSCNSDGYMLV